ncbi:MAG: hypothetical protein GXY53_03650 [Desulfobulbus sp.]|nr:hypothetical protein [Desulfobulbus sp.]
MNHSQDEPNGLLDDDPALDYILLEEMRKESRRPPSTTGCLGMVVTFLLPAVSLWGMMLFF